MAGAAVWVAGAAFRATSATTAGWDAGVVGLCVVEAAWWAGARVSVVGVVDLVGAAVVVEATSVVDGCGVVRAVVTVVCEAGGKFSVAATVG